MAGEPGVGGEVTALERVIEGLSRRLEVQAFTPTPNLVRSEFHADAGTCARDAVFLTGQDISSIVKGNP